MDEVSHMKRGEKKKKQEAPRAVDTPLHAQRPGPFTILGNPSRC